MSGKGNQGAPRLEPRGGGVLVCAPSGRDAEEASAALESIGLPATVCPSISSLGEELRGRLVRLESGVFALIIAEEALATSDQASLLQALREQPPWSDLPVILLSSPSGVGPEARLDEVVSRLGNVTVLERPMQRISLLSAVQVGLRQRLRQYEMRDVLMRREQDVRSRDHFLAMLGHELRNPVSAIVLSTKTLDSTDPQAIQQYRDIVDRQSSKLRRLIDDILDVSRTTKESLHIEIAPLDLRSVVTRALETERHYVDEKGLRLEVLLDERTVPVRGDTIRLEQVVHNLVWNAVKFTPSGGVVTIEVERGEDQARLRVSDSGEGIPRDRLRQIFLLFTQMDDAVTRHRGGLGLGLPLVENIIRLHGGSISAESEGVGRGTTFRVCLPLAAEMEPEVPSPTPEPRSIPEHKPKSHSATAGSVRTGVPAVAVDVSRKHKRSSMKNKHRVLLVEDDDDNREMLVLLLTRKGFEVTPARNGTEALELLSKMEPDTALVDIGLPDIDGYEVGRQARRIHGDKILLLALTGYGHADAKQRTRDVGFDEHLTKPVDLKRLEKIIAAGKSPAAPAGDGSRPRPSS